MRLLCRQQQQYKQRSLGHISSSSPSSSNSIQLDLAIIIMIIITDIVVYFSVEIYIAYLAASAGIVRYIQSTRFIDYEAFVQILIAFI